MLRTLLKVFGGGGWWWLRMSLVFTFGPKPQLKFRPSSTKCMTHFNLLIKPKTIIKLNTSMLSLVKTFNYGKSRDMKPL